MERPKKLSTPEESPEEAGARVIRELLAAPDPPRTLEEDLLETSMRIVQEKDIIPLQRALERQKAALRASIAAKLEEHFRANPHLTKEQRASRHDAARAYERKQIAELREHTKKLINDLHAVRQRRDEAIRAWCRTHDCHNPIVPPLSVHSIAPNIGAH